MTSAGEEPTVEPPEEEFDLTKPYWVGYFRLPKEDVKLQKEFLPTRRQALTSPCAARYCLSAEWETCV